MSRRYPRRKRPAPRVENDAALGLLPSRQQGYNWFRSTVRRSSLEPIPSALRNKYRGQVAIVMMTGPSLADYDLKDSFFTENVTFGGNNTGALFEPTYYLLTDPVAVRKYWGSIAKCQRSTFLVGEFAKPSFNARRHNLKSLTIEYDRVDRIGTPGDRIYHGGTVGCVAFQCAWLMGFKYIFLLGLDGYGVKGIKHATGTQPVGSRRHDRVVEHNLTLAMTAAQRQGRYIFNLSYRSVYTQVPKFYSVAEAKGLVNPQAEEANG